MGHFHCEWDYFAGPLLFPVTADEAFLQCQNITHGKVLTPFSRSRQAIKFDFAEFEVWDLLNQSTKKLFIMHVDAFGQYLLGATK